MISLFRAQIVKVNFRQAFLIILLFGYMAPPAYAQITDQGSCPEAGPRGGCFPNPPGDGQGGDAGEGIVAGISKTANHYANDDPRLKFSQGPCHAAGSDLQCALTAVGAKFTTYETAQMVLLFSNLEERKKIRRLLDRYDDRKATLR